MSSDGMDNNETTWTLHYHTPGGQLVKGRGEFLRLMFEDSQTPFEEVGDCLYGATGIMDAFRGSTKAIDDGSEILMYPPAIRHVVKGDTVCWINQVGACMIYLGDELGYAPSSNAERARANCILLNALDFIGEGRASFHPVKNSMSYNDQKEEGDRASKEFSEVRLLTFLHHFNKVVKTNGDPTKPVAGGPNTTYADFALFHVLDATKAQFNNEFYGMAWDNANVPQLKQFYDSFRNRPQLVEYLQSDRCCAFAGDSMM